VLRICIPVHNEATTIGVLLWRLRAVFQGFSREYDVVVYDDASTDGTAEVLEPYQSVMPLRVIRGAEHRGYAASIDALVRHVAADDEYARRDAMVLLQGDFTESPEHLPELVKRFEGGADLVAVHRGVSDATPAEERRLRRWGRWAVTPFLRLPPVADPFTGFRLVRISVLRDLLKALGSRPVCVGDGWAANIDFALNVTPFARRIENVEFAPRYDVRQRGTRRRGWPDLIALFHWARAARRVARPSPGSRPIAEPAARPERTTEVAASSPPTRREQRPPTRERTGELASAPTARRDQRPPRPPRPERAPRPEPPAVAAAAAEQLLKASSAAPNAATSDLASAADADPSAPESKRSRRRRRRSKRDRGRQPGDVETTAAQSGAPTGTRDHLDFEPGTSDDGPGDEDDDRADGDDGGGTAQTDAVDGATRRKRRSRRRRRSRQRGSDGAGNGTAPGNDSSPPPAAEPPVA
jgi:hypothetical protein